MSEEQKPADNDAADLSAAEPSSDVEALRAEAQALKEQVLRYAADAENTRRRAEREANDARAYAIQKFAKDLLGVADNLARALAAAGRGGRGPCEELRRRRRDDRKGAAVRL